MRANSPFARWLSSLAAIFFNAAVQAVALVIFARSLGSAEYGVIVLVVAVAAIAAEFVGFGSGDLLIREVSRNPSTHRAAFAQALRLVCITVLPVSAVATIITGIAFKTGTSTLVIFVLIISEILSTRLVFMSEQVAIAHHATHAANANRISAGLIRLSIVCIAVFGFGIESAAEWAPFAALSAAVASVGSLALSIRRFGPPDFEGRRKGLIHVGGLFSAMQIIRAVQYSVDKLAVGAVGSSASIGAYGVASRISQLGIMPTSAITRITYPKFFSHGAGGLLAALAFARRVAWPVIGVAVISSVLLAVISTFLPLLFGSDYDAARPYLLMVCMLPLAAAFQNIFGDTLSGADHQKERVIAAAIGLCLTVAATVAGLLQGGAVGAIVGYLIGQFLFAAATGATVFVLSRKGAA